MTVKRQQKRVNMIRHHHKSIEQVPGTLEMLQCASHNFGRRFFSKETRAVPPIEPLFAGFLEATLVLMLSPHVPRFRVKF